MPMMPFIGVRISWLTVAEEARFGLARIFGALARRDQRAFLPACGGDVARDRAMRDRRCPGRAPKFDPGKPARSVGRRGMRDIGRAQALAVGEGGVRHDRRPRCRGPSASRRPARAGRADQIGEHLVGVDDAAIAVAVDRRGRRARRSGRGSAPRSPATPTCGRRAARCRRGCSFAACAAARWRALSRAQERSSPASASAPATSGTETT